LEERVWQVTLELGEAAGIAGRKPAEEDVSRRGSRGEGIFSLGPG